MPPVWAVVVNQPIRARSSVLGYDLGNVPNAVPGALLHGATALPSLAFHVIVTFAGAPACVTDIVRVSPPPVTVMVPVRLLVLGLATALIRKLPFPVRFVGDTFVAVNQFTLLVGAFHVMLDVTLMVVFPPPDPGLHAVGDTVSVAGWVLTRISAWGERSRREHSANMRKVWYVFGARLLTVKWVVLNTVVPKNTKVPAAFCW